MPFDLMMLVALEPIVALVPSVAFVRPSCVLLTHGC